MVQNPYKTSLILRQRPPKSYKLLKYFMIPVILFQMSKHSDFHLIFFHIEGAWQDFTVVTKLTKIFFKDVCMDFELYFKVHNLVSVYPKSIILGQMTNLNMIFMWWCQFIDWLKFETCPISLLNFGTTNSHVMSRNSTFL